MSPVSVDGSDWSGINQYQKTDPPFSPTFSNRSNLATPPTSGVPSGTLGPNGATLSTDAPARLSDSGNPSPPSSVAARSSDGTLSDQRGRRYKQMEEILGQHYVTLKRFLHAPYRDNQGSRPNKARDKLLRLSPTQFHELSTDVYDELLRRQQAMPSPGRPGPPRPDIPPFLPPRKDFHEKRNQARQRLASLQHQRFRDLVTDVYCELERRFPHFASRDSRMVSPGGRSPNGYGPPGPNGYPPPGARRSQSRGPPSRMGRGYSSGGPGSPMGGAFPPRKGSLGGPSPAGSVNGDHGPLPKSFQSNTIVPNKSTLVEDDDDMAGTEDDYDARSDAFALDGVLQSRRGTTTTLGDGERKMLADAQSQVSVLQEKVDRLEGLVKSKDDELVKYQDQDKSQVNGTKREEWEELKLELESKVSKAEDLNSSLQLELEKVRTEQDKIGEATAQSTGDNDLQARFADLEIRHKDLQAELLEQQHVTEEVRREASTFLMEMRTMSEQSHSNWEREEQLTNQVHKLEEEVKQWKSRYAKAKTQLRHLRTSSVGISDSRPDVGMVSRENELMHEDGLVKDVHVTKFQIAIDELLRIARFDDHRLVMQQIKPVIMAVRHVLQDVEAASNPETHAKATRKVSATANNLITASKNFASLSGLSPVSLLDAAASHLSTAVIELIQLAKIRATPVDELEDDDEGNLTQLKSPDYFSVTPSQGRLSNNESIYSALSPPSVQSRDRTNSHLTTSEHVVPNKPEPATQFNYSVQPEDHELQELKLYVEDQTEGLVQSIQALVASIRAEDALITVRTHVSAISSVVTNVASSTEHLINKPGAHPALRERSGPIIQTLDAHRGRLVETAADGEDAFSAEQLREITNKLPPIAFEIARETKELVQRLEPANYEDEDDFR
ncbi:hypothetical protein ASPWEDRAFT_172308 [Aspergillus wentii DTO 134E9]|uniref:GIT Spa2 homology (SHD) domain-containing protein n=1 Tax=Aspergillus wentii DTO 134E9 TaxID=1073089 RepID=A0A1L9RKP5_ASPWE|nr:uncharacterized protein ASPWEDRAFT_172308 [Aspergillus wentii DTO 134E9]OJJ35506.1 hypothetical protein ASPWEDRAFT_172308 [Aspergillus wentii DTO 134E9]